VIVNGKEEEGHICKFRWFIKLKISYLTSLRSVCPLHTLYDYHYMNDEFRLKLGEEEKEKCGKPSLRQN
jgi:hypothetical protein